MSAHNEQCMADLYDSGYSIGSKSMGDTNDDIFWKLLGSFLVFFMQAGFAMLEAGQVRVKNRNVTLMKVCLYSRSRGCLNLARKLSVEMGRVSDFGPTSLEGVALRFLKSEGPPLRRRPYSSFRDHARIVCLYFLRLPPTRDQSIIV